MCAMGIKDISFNTKNYYNDLRTIMNSNGQECTQKYINVLDYLLDAINIFDIKKYSIDYIKILDAIRLRAQINNKEIYLNAWDINKDANIVDVKIIENGKYVLTRIDKIFNLDLKEYLN